MNATKTKSSRVPYGFKLTFPSQFTMRELRKTKHHKVSYITLYKRVKKELATGTLVAVGKKEPAVSRRGRKELVYQVVT